MICSCSTNLALPATTRPLALKADEMKSFVGVLWLRGEKKPEPIPDESTLPFFSHTPVGKEKADTAHPWDEKTGWHEAKPSNALATKPYSLSDRLNKNGFALVLDYFSPWGQRGRVISPPCEKPPVLLKEVVPAQPKLTLVNSEVADIASPMAKVNPLTVEYLQALKADLPGMVTLLERVRDVTGAAPYKLELMRLKYLLEKVIKPERPDDPKSALCFSGFNPAQVDSLRERVNALSTHDRCITQSRQRFFKFPDLSYLKSFNALLVGTGYFIGALAACSMGVSIPALILASASLSLAGLIAFSVYDRFKALEVEESTGDINKLTLFTQRFKNLKDAAIMSSFAVQDRRMQTIETTVNNNQQSQAQELQEVKGDLNSALRAIAELRAELAAIKDSAAEGQPTATLKSSAPKVKQEDKLTIA